MASAMESELGVLLENYLKATSMLTSLADMGHQQPPTLVTTDNTAANRIVKEKEKLKRYRSIGMRFYWVRCRILKIIFTYSGKRKRQT